jgi:hypothetical protein
MNWAGWHRMYSALRKKERYVFVLDDLRSRHNVGSVFPHGGMLSLWTGWTCAASRPFAPRTVRSRRTALGATSTVLWTHHADAVSAVETVCGRLAGRFWAVETDRTCHIPNELGNR